MLRNRLIYLAVWILSIVGISFYGGTLSYGLFWTLTLLPVVMYAYLLFVLLGFRIYQNLNSHGLVSRAPVSYYFTLQNESPFAFARIRVSFYEFGVDYGLLNRDACYELMPHSGYSTTTPIICKYRGEYPIGIKKIILTDFLNLFSLHYKNREPLMAQVLPAIEYPTGSMGEEECLFSKNASLDTPTIRDLLVRPYVSGDSLRSINWKASAKNNKLMVARLTSEEQNNVHILLNTMRYSENYEEYIPREDALLTRLITLTIYFLNRHNCVEIHYVSEGLRHLVLSSMTDFERFYAEVSGIVFGAQNDVSLLKVTAENVLYLGTESLGEEVQDD